MTEWRDYTERWGKILGKRKAMGKDRNKEG